MKINAALLLFLIVACLQGFAVASGQGNIISIFSPVPGATRNREQVISGKLEVPFIRNIDLKIEPFMEPEQKREYHSKLNVIEGSFNDKITLFPGLNIIRLSTQGGKYEVSRAVFLITPQKEEKAKNELDSLGANSPIVFTYPKEPTLHTPEITVKGVVTDSSLKSVDAIVMNTMDFLSTEPSPDSKDKGAIDYKTAKVRNMQFEFNVKLTDGLNVILARPDSKTAPVDRTQMISIVYEKTSELISLEEPLYDKKNITLKGRVNNPGIKTLKINITALVESELKPGRIFPKSILEKTVQTGKDGSFFLKTSLQTQKEIYSIKYSPTITVSAGNTSVSRTLLNW